MERKIIIGYDPEHGGNDALRLGRLFAEVLAAQPLILTALPWPGYLMGVDDLQKQIDAEMHDRFAEIRDELQDFAVETHAMASRSAAEALYGFAETAEAKMVVLGSCHRGPIGRTLAGSVAESLLHGAPCAITIAPRGYGDRGQAPLLRIAVAFDGSPEAWTALETGIGIAERCHGQLTVISVADFPSYGYAVSWSILTAGEFRDYEQEEKRRLLELALGRVPAGLQRESRLLIGDPGSELTRVSADFDLMVTGSRAYGPLRRTLLGSATRKLIQASACPVLVLPRAVGVDPLGLRVAGGAERPAHQRVTAVDPVLAADGLRPTRS
jgi:nucleotide-binding universal stress UspA family protein